VTDWSFLSYELARHGIPSDVHEIVTSNYKHDFDPWRPSPDVDGLQIVLDREGADRLAHILDSHFSELVERELTE
jgi:hypothetical protein